MQTNSKDSKLCSSHAPTKIISAILMTAVVITLAFSEADAGFPAPPGILIPPGLPGSSVNVQVNGYLPAPPGVIVQVDAGRPYYVERDRRVYMEREKPAKHYKKQKKHHDDNGRKEGHYKQDKHDH